MIKVDYSKATFKMLCLRKHLLKDITYFLYVVDNVLYLSNVIISTYSKGIGILVAQILDPNHT